MQRREADEQAFHVRPIGFVHGTRRDRADDDWERESARIVLADEFEPEALDGLETFSHLEVLFVFDRVRPEEIERGARHPRDDPRWPRVGIFAQRRAARPNRIGATIVELVSRTGRELVVRGLDAIDGTPVLDLKPVLVEFLPRTPVRQPAWCGELMREYWRSG